MAIGSFWLIFFSVLIWNSTDSSIRLFSFFIWDNYFIESEEIIPLKDLLNVLFEKLWRNNQCKSNILIFPGSRVGGFETDLFPYSISFLSVGTDLIIFSCVFFESHLQINCMLLITSRVIMKQSLWVVLGSIFWYLNFREQILKNFAISCAFNSNYCWVYLLFEVSRGLFHWWCMMIIIKTQFPEGNRVISSGSFQTYLSPHNPHLFHSNLWEVY